MGYPMCKNLHAGLGSSKKFLICDTNEEAISRFRAEAGSGANVEVIKTGFEAARRAVREHI